MFYPGRPAVRFACRIFFENNPAKCTECEGFSVYLQWNFRYNAVVGTRREVRSGFFYIYTRRKAGRHNFQTLKFRKNMAKKVIFADNILRAKGISKRNFDTSELNGLVEDFFMTHEANARFMIVSVRFADEEGMPDSGIENHLDSSFYQWNIRDVDPEDLRLFEQDIRDKNKDYNLPMIIIDEPFIKNVASYLRSICGFTVKRSKDVRPEAYVVSLPL